MGACAGLSACVELDGLYSVCDADYVFVRFCGSLLVPASLLVLLHASMCVSGLRFPYRRVLAGRCTLTLLLGEPCGRCLWSPSYGWLSWAASGLARGKRGVACTRIVLSHHLLMCWRRPDVALCTCECVSVRECTRMLWWAVARSFLSHHGLCACSDAAGLVVMPSVVLYAALRVQFLSPWRRACVSVQEGEGVWQFW